jgi:NhaP-type Na+/H+ or K+/H+ antiporter
MSAEQKGFWDQVGSIANAIIGIAFGVLVGALLNACYAASGDRSFRLDGIDVILSQIWIGIVVGGILGFLLRKQIAFLLSFFG